MKGLSEKEIEILLVLVKDFSSDYNANSISKKIDITAAGAFKALKNLKKRKLVVSKRMGKAIFYKVNLADYYTFRTIETLIIGEARENAQRWLDEFEELLNHVEIAIMFGSMVRNPKKANDIDLMLVFKKEKSKIISKLVEERRAISTKPIHIVKQTLSDLKDNLKKRDKVILNVIKNSHILCGHDKLTEVIKDVTSF